VLRRSDVSAGATPDTSAVSIQGPATALEDSVVSGGSAAVRVTALGPTLIARARVEAAGVTEAAVRCDGCNGLDVVSSELRLGGAARGIESRGEPYRPAVVDASQLTVVGRGSDATVGVAAVTPQAPYTTASVQVDNSILHRVGRALVATAPAGGPGAVVTAVRSNYDPAANLVTGSAQLTQSLRTTLDPRFVDAARGDLRLAHDSQLIDLGRAAPFVAAGSALGGLPRAVDGNWVPGAAPDLGAYEYQAAVPVARIAGPARVPAWLPVTLDATRSSDSDAGDALTFTWILPGGERATGPVLTRAFAPGRTPVTLNVTDPTGRRGTATHVVDAVVAPAAVPPLLSGARVAPREVRRGRRAELRLVLARPARATAFLQRRVDGRWRFERRVQRPLPAGAGVVPFVRGMTATLPRGRYRAFVTARGDQESATAKARFRVVGRRH